MARSDQVVARNFLALGAGETIARVVAFGATVYLARTLGTEMYGVIGFALAVLLYFIALAEAGTESVGVRDIAHDKERAGQTASVFVATRLVLSLCLAAMLAAVSLLFLPKPDGTILAIYALVLLPFGLNCRWLFLGMENARTVAISRTTGELVIAGLVVLLIHGPGDVARAPLAHISGEAVAAVVLAVMAFRRGMTLVPQFDRRLALAYLRRAAPIIAHSMLGLMIFNADFIFLRVLRDSSAVGIYAAAYTLISFLLNLGGAYGLSLLPALTRLGPDPSAERSLYDTAMAQVHAVSFPIAIGGFLLAGPIVGLIFGPAYQAAGPALQVLIWSIPAALLRTMPQTALISRGRNADVMKTGGWAAALNLTLNAALIPRFGVIGAAGATVATECLRTGLALRYVSRAGIGLTPSTRFWRATVAGLGMGVALLATRPAPLWAGLAIGVVTYAALLALLGGISFHRGSPPTLSV